MLKAETITSIKDPRVIEARELTSAAGRARRRKCLLEGAESMQLNMFLARIHANCTDIIRI